MRAAHRARAAQVIQEAIHVGHAERLGHGIRKKRLRERVGRWLAAPGT